MVKVSYRLVLFIFASVLGVAVMPSLAFAVAGPDIGGVLDNLSGSLRNFPNILTTISFVSGIFLAVSGVLKLKNHVDNPSQIPISDGIKRLIAGGLFIGLPLATNIAKGSIFGTSVSEVQGNAAGWNVVVPAIPPVGLDQLAVTFISSFAEPMKDLMITFSYLSGLAFILIGISRLIKTAQEGPRGPTGMGTLITFLTGAALMSLGQSMGSFTSSLFGNNTMRNFVDLSAPVQAALSAAEEKQLENVIGSVMMFVSIVGFVAFVRGMYVLKAVADGNQQHSLTQAFTFLLGGALAVNLGDVINMIQSTIGATALGFSFS